MVRKKGYFPSWDNVCRITDYIEHNPGCNVMFMSRRVDISYGTCFMIVKHLKERNIITAEKRGRQLVLKIRK